MKRPIPAGIARREFAWPALLILLGLIHGILYVFIIPPWQHYDEPTQFEYAWLLANRKGLPAQGDFDQGMRREVAASMIEHKFFHNLGFQPDLLSVKQPVWIGISQTGDHPLYYWLVSLPIWLLKGTDITLQLYLGRLASLILYLASILAAYGTARELAPPGHPLRWMLPLTLVLLPGFTDLMSGLNNDVGATAFFSLFFWSGIVLLRRGFSWSVLALNIGTALLCFWTKSTVIFAVFLFAIPFLFCILPGSRKWLAWAVFTAAALAGLLLLFRQDEAALWYRKGLQEKPTRSYHANAPLGSHALELVQLPGATPGQIYQPLPIEVSAKLTGKTVTLGAWVWASEPVTIQAPALEDASKVYSQKIQIGTHPSFYSFTVQMSEKPGRVRILLAPGVNAAGNPITIDYDGLTLVEGELPQGITPSFLDPEGRQGRWGDQPFSNLIRNASAEKAWFRLRPQVERFLHAQSPVFSPAILSSLGDWQGAGWYYQEAGRYLLQTFWGEFGWGHIVLEGAQTYLFLALISLAGFLGGLIFLLRRWRVILKEILLFATVAILPIWVAAFFRGIDSLSGPSFIPSARYAFPAVVPTMLLMTAGWLELLRPLRRWKPAGPRIQAAVFLILFLGLDILSFWSIVQFYANLAG